METGFHSAARWLDLCCEVMQLLRVVCWFGVGRWCIEAGEIQLRIVGIIFVIYS